MSYNYQTERPYVFTEEGQKTFLKIRDKANELLKSAGAFNMHSVIRECTGLNWSHMACVDRLVELEEIREIDRGQNCPGQYRIFVRMTE